MLAAITNRKLFSEDFLRNRLPKRVDWRHTASDRELLERICEIYAAAGELLETANELQLRDNIIDKVLAIVNPHFLGGQSLSTGGEPDYLFFADSKTQHRKEIETVIAVGDAKGPGEDFDKAPPGKRSPVRQVQDYMVDTRTHWGILTDGRRWRLLNLESPSDWYLEIDLYGIAATRDSEQWLYFYNLFRREAFVPLHGKCFLDSVRAESAKYTQAVGNALKERAYRALLELAQGFAAWPENQLDASREEVRQRIRENCFILLYRLLFAFYAEALNLLPLQNDAYRSISLEAIRDRTRGASKDGSEFLTDSRQIWNSLKDLFRLIDKGNRKLGISPYNGGLFTGSVDGSLHADFLERCDISDTYLARALDLLSTAPKVGNPKDFVSVDYANLEVRHLGSIYEGLLEYQLAYADRELVAVRNKDRQVWIPADEYKGKTPLGKVPADKRVQAGRLYLETERHERRVTGSYYTPDYVVKYIVGHTLRPLVEERRALAKNAHRRQSDAILSIRICDPAMGSGHFLVEATEVLAYAFREAIAEDQETGLYGDVAGDRAWAKREVASHCIYGVDQNPLAVELAKVSLWLHTVSKDRPLSFLDHHLACGNSLVGARLDSIAWLPGEVPAETSASPIVPSDLIMKVLNRYREIERISDETAEVVKQKQVMLQQLKVSREYQRIKKLADVHVGLSLANGEPTNVRTAYMELANEAYFGDEQKWRAKSRAVWAQAAASRAERHRAFHWELEFPELFFEGSLWKSDSGFDVVLGNPPYGYRVARELERYFDQAVWRAESENIAEVFIASASRRFNSHGRYSFIVPKQLTYIPTWREVRKLLNGEELRLYRIADVSEAFEDVLLEQCIFFVKHGSVSTPAERAVYSDVCTEGLVVEQGPLPSGAISDDLWRIHATEQSRDIFLKISAVSMDLTSLGPVFPGIKNVRPFLTKDSGEVILRGDNIGRYRFYGELLRIPLSNIPPGIAERQRRAKILVQDIVAHVTKPMPHIILMANIDEDRLFFETLNSFTLDPGSHYDYGYVLAIMNSRLNAWYVHRFIYNLSVRTMHYRPGHLDFTPIRRITFTTPPEERARMVGLGTGLCSQVENGNPVDCQRVMEFVDQCLRPQLEMADVIHDLLASLAQKMRMMHEDRDLEVGKFLDWLEREVVRPHSGKTLGELSGKSAIESLGKATDGGIDQSTDVILEVLKKNRVYRKFVPSNDRRVIQVEFGKIWNRIRPLARAIEATDSLIDGIVYRVYGLTAKDVALIESCPEEEARSRYGWGGTS